MKGRPSTRTLNEVIVLVWMLSGLVALTRGNPQVGATWFLVAAIWRLGNLWRER